MRTIKNWLAVWLIAISAFFTTGNRAVALDPQYIVASPYGWNCTVNGTEYWSTPYQLNTWSVEIHQGYWNGVKYQYTLVATLFHNQVGTYEFNDYRAGPPSTCEYDILFMLFKTYGVPYQLVSSHPTPQGYFEGNDYGFGNWHSWIGEPPLGSTWSAFRAFHNKDRADELLLQLMDCGYGITHGDLPQNMAQWVNGWGQY